MAAAPSPTPSQIGAIFGVVTVDGVQYIEQPRLFTLEVPITQPFQVLTNQQFTLPGVANFLLKGLSRDVVFNNQSNALIRFRFRISNTQGSTEYFSGGLGVINDRVFDQLCFGSAQFPYPLVPPVPMHAAGTLVFEIEDVSGVTPYTICLGLHGTYLIPAQKQTG
jgi:hypothetical protein